MKYMCSSTKKIIEIFNTSLELSKFDFTRKLFDLKCKSFSLVQKILHMV